MRDYINGKKVLPIVAEFEVVQASVNQWLRWYDTAGTEAPEPRKAAWSSTQARPDAKQGAHPADRGRTVGCWLHGSIWMGPQSGDLVRRKFDVRDHDHHIPKLLHQLGFLVQRFRMRLARRQRSSVALLAFRDPALVDTKKYG